MATIIFKKQTKSDSIKDFIRNMEAGNECSFDISKRRIVQNYTSDFKAIGRALYRTSTQCDGMGGQYVHVVRLE